MNGAQVLGHRYFGTGLAKSDMGRFCACGKEMSLQHILLGCSTYKLQPLLDELTNVLHSVSPSNSFRTLHPDEWGHSPWYPLLALKEIEEGALPIFKGRKTVLRALGASQQRREWVIGQYYWALWKWCMKEIHEEKFKFIPSFCTDLIREVLLTPVPAHLLRKLSRADNGADIREPAALPVPADPQNSRNGLDLLPPPVSHVLNGGAGAVELAQRVSGRKNRKDLSPPRKLRPMYIVRVAKATRVIQINRTVRSKEKHMKGRADCLKWRADCLTSSMSISLPCGNNHRSQHNPLDARRQPPESCVESEHGAELGELGAAKWFGEYIGRVLVSRDMRHGDRPLFNLFAYPVVSTVNVFHGALVFRVFQYLDGRLVVHEERRRACCIVAKLIEQVLHPYDFAADF